MKPKVSIITIAGMISAKDWQQLDQKATVEYIEQDKISVEELLEKTKNTEYLMLNMDIIPFVPEQFYKAVKERNYRLKAISIDSTGATWVNSDVARKYGVKILNTPNFSTISVAEFAFAQLLLHAKKIYMNYVARMKGEKEKPLKNDVLYGKTLGIIGLGNIGTKMAQLGLGFGMSVIAYNRTPKSVDKVAVVSLEDVFKNADYISLHLRTTDETRGIVDKKLLQITKEGVIIVNQADGKLVNNNDMLVAIQSGKVGGYTTSSESVEGDKLEKEENVTFFPPQAWYTEHSLGLLRKTWVGNILNALRNEFPNEVH